MLKLSVLHNTHIYFATNNNKSIFALSYIKTYKPYGDKAYIFNINDNFLGVNFHYG